MRLAANALHRSDSALGAFLRRKKAQLGAPKAIMATAHKPARIIYSMLRYGQGYMDADAQYYESEDREVESGVTGISPDGAVRCSRPRPWTNHGHHGDWSLSKFASRQPPLPLS